MLQNKALRFISFADFRSPSSPIYVNLNVLRLDDLFSVQKAIFMYNLHYTNLPRALHNYALPPTHRYPTSYANNLNYVTPSVRTNRGKSSIKFSGPQTWASIPTNIKECGSRKVFTKSCKDHYLKILSIASKDKKIIPYKKTEKSQNNSFAELFESDEEVFDFFGFEPENTAQENNVTIES